MAEPTETAKQVKPIWKCEVKNCDIAFPPTLYGYYQITGHQLKHANKGVPKKQRVYHLIDENTGEVLARSIKEAMPFLMVETPKPTPPPEVKPKLEVKPEVEAKPEPEVKPTPKPTSPPEVKPKLEVKPEVEAKPKPEAEQPEVEVKPPEAEKISKVDITTVKTAGNFAYEITLPADAFMLFNLAKACGLEPNGDKLFDEWIWDCVRARFSKDYKKQLVLAPVEA